MDSVSYQMIDDATGLIVDVTITENGDGTLTFDLAVNPETGVIGDLNAIYFDLAEGYEYLLDSMVATGTDVTGEKYQEDKVTKIDNFTNVNGEVVNELGKFDLGVQLGTSGMSEDDIQTTSFTLSADEPLTLEMFYSQDSAIRLTSVGEEDGAREDSLKIGGEVPEEPQGPTNIANDDVMRVSENETFSFDPSFFTDPLNVDGLDSDNQLTDNDTTDGAPYTGTVVSVDGEVLNEDGFIFVSNGSGGELRVYEDGRVDFAATGIDLAEGEEIVIDYIYEIESGATATLSVTVFGEADGGGGGGGGIDGVDGGFGEDGGTDDGTDPVLDDPFVF